MAIVSRHEADLVAAVDGDFGHRSAHETRLAELYIVAAEATHAMRASAPLDAAASACARHCISSPGARRIVRAAARRRRHHQPVELSGPARAGARDRRARRGQPRDAQAVRVHAAHSELLREGVAARVRRRRVRGRRPAVPESAAAFTRLPFDHLFFTGSTAVGRQVARGGGREPDAGHARARRQVAGARSTPRADFALAAPRLVVGKLLNAGQTCIAPDYVLVPRAASTRSSPRCAPPCARSIRRARQSRLHVDRQRAPLRAAGGAGRRRAREGRAIVELRAGRAPDPARAGSRRRCSSARRDDMAVMQEEIFGPLLPIEALRVARRGDRRGSTRRPRPLALYYFGADGARARRAARADASPAASPSTTRCGTSRTRTCRSAASARRATAPTTATRASHVHPRQTVFVQPRFAAAQLLYPPYGRRFEKVLALLKRLLDRATHPIPAIRRNGGDGHPPDPPKATPCDFPRSSWRPACSPTLRSYAEMMEVPAACRCPPATGPR